MSYYPKRPVKSFQDLEVYQKLLAIAVVIVKRTKVPHVILNSFQDPNETGTGGHASTEGNIGTGTIQALHDCALSLPIKIAAAHSLRFGNTEQAIRILEEIMVGCNKIVVYLELYRDLYNFAPESPAPEVVRSRSCPTFGKRRQVTKGTCFNRRQYRKRDD